MPSPFNFTCPLPADDLRFESMTATQALSALEAIEVTLVSSKPDIAAEKLLGEPAGVTVALREGGKRFFNGIVARFAVGKGSRGRHYRYHATLRPWLWFLTRTSDCRIFQDMTVPEIVEKVFGDHGAIANFEFKLFGSYRKRTYCVQYRESDFQFIARLMEEEGIYWFFVHAEGAHKLMLVDDIGALPTAAEAETLPFHALAGGAPPDVDYIGQWSCTREVRTGKTALASYDFERPTTPLLVEQKHARSHSLDDYERFDFEGDYTQKADGQHLADVLLDEHQARFERAAGGTNARALAVGHLFKLDRHPRSDQNAQYLCAQLHVSAHVAPYEAGTGGGAAGGDASDYQCQFTAAPATQAWRPECRTPKPRVGGPQTALVVGPSGEEIFTDKYGRVKVQFHWDRYGKKNEKSSCWVRVSTPWAGKSFGFIQIPRIGQEVVVDFLEGDPDQPLITGRVYNAEQMPPWELPANATQSGVLTRSSKGGAYGNANAIRFEDKKGAEQLWIHAEKNMDIEVENDETHWVGHDRTKTIDHDETVMVKHDRTETVGHDETITIGNNRTETVAVDEAITIGANRTEAVGANETITIGANRSITVGASETATVALQRTHAVGVNESIAIGAAQEVAIGAAQTIAVGANQSTSVGANQSTSVGGNRAVEVGKDETHKVGANRTATVGKDDKLSVGKNLVIDAGDSVTIKTGSASITMKKDGTITIKGKDITIDGSGKVNVKASGDIVMKGSKILQN
ncbi:MAG: type VI secretion system tip protein VgrG [Betaproteobacteria bacterium]|nr:type VI secretion system tip protein VgrG [Betaproteobacteria bacterium]MCC6247269.1 type VI secretion system tip protein VgrG [Rubrivivax sp.]